MKKNDIWKGRAEGYTYDGAGVVHTGGVVFFVPGLLDGEEAELGVTKMKKNYGYARIVKLLRTSEHRTQPVCSVYKKCGGCQLMHMDYEEQKRFKENKVKGVFLQNAQMDITPLPILTSDHLLAYRNKVQIPVQVNHGKVMMGFYQNHSNTIVEYDACAVQTEESNRIAKDIRSWIDELGCASAFRHVLIKYAHRSGEIMVCLVVRSLPLRNQEKLIERLKENYPGIQSITAIENRREDNVILDGKETVLFGRAYIEETLLGSRFRISARSFFQINPYATELLYSTAMEYAGLTGKETVIDLYCGTGTIGILCAGHAKKVYGIEIVEDAVKDAKVNAKLNGIDNIEFFTADASRGAERLLKNKIRPDAVIVDPPRKGCSKETLNAILKMSPERIVYVSCDPSTLARDCRILSDNHYTVEKIQPVDMFPMTTHVETVVLLRRENVDGYVDINLEVEKLTGKGGTASYTEIKDYVKEKYG
ncbi:MAG: 23S rRNA (uracil(1939)-C(5))-methyltransferase RlmD, partial [Solobacterium sp.]|nr:23S rRNA (uracil(1939)-C(5))-methyltransferase RlmD [Solobacterium sp.]